MLSTNFHVTAQSELRVRQSSPQQAVVTLRNVAMQRNDDGTYQICTEETSMFLSMEQLIRLRAILEYFEMDCDACRDMTENVQDANEPPTFSDIRTAFATSAVVTSTSGFDFDVQPPLNVTQG